MIRAERNISRFVVRHRDYFMAETPQQFRPRVYPFFVIADLKQDSLRFRLNGNLLAGLLVGDHVFTRRRGRQYFHPRLGTFHVFRRFHPARAVAFHLENVESRNHGVNTCGLTRVSNHTSPFMSTQYHRTLLRVGASIYPKRRNCDTPRGHPEPERPAFSATRLPCLSLFSPIEHLT